MAPRNTPTPEPVNEALQAFLNTQPDESATRELGDRLEVHLTGNLLYIPTFTRQSMNTSHGSTVMALETRTDVEGGRVFYYPARNPDARGARRLRTTESMGPAVVSFGVPLRKLKLKYKVSRRVVFPVHTLQTPEQGTVYWISFAEVELEARNIDLTAVAAAKQAKAVKAKESRARKRQGKPAAPPETPAV
jgi:hypothetical protein